MIKQKPLDYCKNWQTEMRGNYCSNCGRAKALKRIDKNYILHEIGSVLNLDRGIFYSIRELLIRPDQNIREFLLEDRNRLVKPILFIIISSLVYTLTNQLFHFDNGYVNYNGSENLATSTIFKWVQEHYGYSNIIMGVFVAFWVAIFFKKYQYNFFEILILICFVMGIGMLVFSLFGIIEGITQIHMMQISGILVILYFSWAIGRFFERKTANYFKAFVAYILGIITFTLVALAVGDLINLIIT